MGNSNLKDVTLEQSELQLSKHSSFYGRHETKGNLVVKKYELNQNQNEAFLGLIQCYQKIKSQSLIKVEDVRFVKEQNHKYHYQLSFPYYPITLADEIIEKERRYSQKQILKLICDVGEAVIIFNEKQFPFSQLSPSKIAVRDFQQGYCIGIDILMNPKITLNQKGNEKVEDKIFISPQEKSISRSGGKIDHSKSQVYSIGLIALSCICEEAEKNTQLKVFNLRKRFSFQFCNLLDSMVLQQNSDRISLSVCLETSKKILQNSRLEPNESSIFIRGYNSIASMCLFSDNVSHDHIKKKWKQKRNKILLK